MKNYCTGELVTSDMSFRADAIAAEAIADGYIAGTVSTPSTDLHGHRVLKGAFDESIKAKGLNGPGGIKLLAYHKPDQWAGEIKRLETIGDNLKIAAQLELELPYVKTLHYVSKKNGGLNFSVGFRLEDFDYVEDKAGPDKNGDTDYVLEIRKAELIEVSIVAFPAQPEATMDFVKHADTPSAFEKALIANGWALSRNQAHQLMELCRNSIHLLEKPMLASSRPLPARPVLDACQLKAATDLTSRLKSLLGTNRTST